MKISTRGRYALRVMVDLGDNFDNGYISLKSIAERQNISLKYIEAVISKLVKAKLIEGKIGKSGGYRLTREPKDYKINEILEITEGSLEPVSCLSCDNKCERDSYCKTLPLWEGLQKVINDYLANISLLDLMKNSERYSEGLGI